MQRSTPDVIGIGAINLDFVYHEKHADAESRPDPATESGSESFDLTVAQAEAEIVDLIAPEVTLGGSALLALRAIHAIDPTLVLGYVGVCGTVSQLIRTKGFGPSRVLRDELQFIQSDKWILDSDPPESVGLALIPLDRGERDKARIAPGANDQLQQLIEFAQSSGQDFAQYLAQAKWIHITSLARLDQFAFLIEQVRAAKVLNRFLVVSVDPGYQYTRTMPPALLDAFQVADFIFLNEKEARNLSGVATLRTKRGWVRFAQAIWNTDTADAQVLIIKSKRQHVLCNRPDDGKPPHRATFFHSPLSQIRIQNDTGAGDAFAGGFITGMLSRRLLLHQPAPVRLGALASAARLQSRDNPYDAIATKTDEFLNTVADHQSWNWRQHVSVVYERWAPTMWTFVAGIATGIVTEFLIRLWLS